MTQKSLLSTVPDAAQRVQVLTPFPVGRAYDYALPAGMTAAAGDYVRVPLGKRETWGVVWDGAADENIDPLKLKEVLEVSTAFPPLPADHRQFLSRVARYTMADAGAVLKMTLSAPDVFDTPKTVAGYRLSAHLPVVKITAARQRVMDVLSDGKILRAADITRETGAGAAVVRGMADAGMLTQVDMTPPAPCVMDNVPDSALVFSDVQQSAADTLAQSVTRGGFSVTLLDGVTGSGKTEVYFEAVAAALQQGKQALVLLPEISLSAQFLVRFERRFGVKPAIYHSAVTQAQRRGIWAGVARGDTRVVIGARSALFLPYRDLGVIVVDEEHEQSYKQEEGVLYHARDMAVMRAQTGTFPVVLVSATPSLETMVNAETGRYLYLHLPHRHAGAVLPAVETIDLKQHPPARQRFLSPPLITALRDNIAAGEQSLLFLNRRGYAPLTLCRTCGHRFQCPSCSAWLVAHKRHDRLQCHHCGYAQKMPKTCPTCHDDGGFAACGPGVERIEEEVKELFPDARTLVLASDVVSGTEQLSAAIAAIENEDIDIIVGTQMIAKGHHFPGLTLVGIVDADLGLSGGDLRAGERTFQLLHQVAGRAGRGEKPGRVMLQTYMKEQAVIRAIAANDRAAFLSAETQARADAGMPPFGKLAGVIVSGPDENALDYFCRAMAVAAPRYDDVKILGPAPAPLAFLRGKYRRRFLLRSARDVSLQNILAVWIEALKIPSQIRIKVDIDPQSFF